MALAAVGVVAHQASAQNKPFPHRAGYVSGFTPSRFGSGDALAIYTKWKREYLNSDCGAGVYRVEFQSPPGSTVSEGIRYGMLLTVYFGDRTDKGCSASNSSYWTPGYDRVFEAFTQDAFWGKMANDAITLWILDRNPTTGFVANAVNQDGTAPTGQSYVDYNGCRLPWRAVLDYLWYGTSEAKSVADRITDWVDARGPGHMFDGYDVDGTARAGARWSGSDCFSGGYATAAMSKSQDRVDRFTAYFESLTVDNYYETSLRGLYALMLSGNFWKPGTPTAASTVPLPGPGAALGAP